MSDHRIRIARIGRHEIADVPIYYVGCTCQWVSHDDGSMVPSRLTLRVGKSDFENHAREEGAA